MEDFESEANEPESLEEEEEKNISLREHLFRYIFNSDYYRSIPQDLR